MPGKNSFKAPRHWAFERLSWVRALATGHPAYDPLAIVLVWSLVVWIVAAWAAWFIRRRERPLLALFPIGVLLAIDLAYTGTSLYPLIGWIGVVVIMQALGSYSIRTRRMAEGRDRPG